MPFLTARAAGLQPSRDRLSKTYIMVIYNVIDFDRIEGFEWDDGNGRKSADKSLGAADKSVRATSSFTSSRLLNSRFKIGNYVACP